MGRRKKIYCTVPVWMFTGVWTDSGMQAASRIFNSERRYGMRKIVLAILDILSLIADKIFEEND